MQPVAQKRASGRGARSASTVWLCVFVAMLSLLLTAKPLQAQATPASPERALLDGRIDTAVSELKAALSAAPRNATNHLLLCRAYYAVANADGAIGECEAALADGAGSSSEAQDWMGRAYGMKAEHAGPFSGLSLARKVRTAFERAVELDPRNAAAIGDLTEFYIGAPGLVGGGTDKALALADRELPLAPQAAHRTRALVAEKRGDAAGAEREFRAAAAGNRPAAWFDLAYYFSRHQQPDAALEALHHAVDNDPQKDSTIVDVASVLTSLHRNPDSAEKLLREYLASNAKTDAAPAFKVHYQLGQLLAANGDKTAAAHEYEASLAMVAGFAPARNALGALNGGKR